MPHSISISSSYQAKNVPESAKTQRSKILRLLIDARGAWVPLPEILDLRIGQYTTRILELRRAGFVIENRTERESGIVLSWYRLVSSPPPEPKKPRHPWKNAFSPRRMADPERRREERDRDRELPLFAGVRS